MPGIVPLAGEQTILDTLTNLPNPSLKVRLFKNAPVIGANTVLADFQEANFDGYGPVAVPNFPLSAIVNGKASSQCPVMTFTKNNIMTANTINGYYVTLVLNGVERLVAAETFATAWPMNNQGDQKTLQITLSVVNDPAP